jgi:phospholipase/carboxylesterase
MMVGRLGRPTRRRLIELGLAGAGSLLATSCADVVEGAPAVARGSGPGSSDDAQPGRLLARPGTPSGVAARDVHAGVQALGLAEPRDARLSVPTSYHPDRPAPLVLSLHGAGGTEEGGLRLLQGLADTAGLLVLAPASRGRSWDVILGGYGPDVAFLDRALAWTFERYAVDPARLAIGGFSDGASYALSLGLTNGDLFSHVLAFSPGFIAPAGRRGAPRLYVSHGTYDTVLPIDACSRRIVPILYEAGYDLRYDEFDGPHTVPPTIAQTALDWILAP